MVRRRRLSSLLIRLSTVAEHTAAGVRCAAVAADAGESRRMEATTVPRMVPGYRHIPGNHCGSTALRNLLAFHGAKISEEMALGLGAGLSFYYVPLDGS